MTNQMQILEKDIVDLRKQQAVKSWQITCFNIITFGIFKYYKNKKIISKLKY
ncbi:hypothetical protein [Spiroplasma endosymbiont of Polydrusus pterygomalis]|uniref:hypothetical protein n=1 Tax=Spiroplasma endosymbiont of Polydrusus pterygomalis TaxID=3139327 RepID=UPI003CCB3098